MRFFRLYKNKIFAIGFCVIGCALLLSSFVISELGNQWHFLRNNPIQLLNYIIYAFVFGMMLVTNIMNDNRAYQSILMFVFYLTFDYVYSLFLGRFSVLPSIAEGDIVGVILGGSLFLVTLFGGAMGIILYIYIRRYMFGRMNDFRKVRIFGALFTLSVVLMVGIFLSVFIIAGHPELILTNLLSLGEVSIAIGVNFTLERLRRF